MENKPMKKIKANDFRAKRGLKLSELSTQVDLDAGELKLVRKLEKTRLKLSALQETMYAHHKYSVLVVFQGMDTSGKDSLIREVFREFNPRGVEVQSFKVPTSAELAHDYLWRHYVVLPGRGKFGVFNRSHYENVLISRVHPEYVLNEHIPGLDAVQDISEEFWETRLRDIRNFEEHLAHNGTIVLKFFLHLGKEEQRQRLLRRLDEEKHNWKFSPDDLREREFWDDYQKCYQDAIRATSTRQAPWFVIPADDKDAARLIVAKIILEQMQHYTDMVEPELDEEIQKRIAYYREKLGEQE